MILDRYKYLLEHKDICFAHDDSESYYAVVNKATMNTLAWVKKYNSDEVKNAILDSQKAQKIWSKTTPLHKSNILWNWYNLVMEHQDDLAWILTNEQGKPLAEAKGEIAYAASFIRWFAEEARRIDGDIISPNISNQKIMVIKQPIGVTSAITPWNFPAAMITRKVAPALAAGCSMIVKPSELTPLTAYALELLATKAGLPDNLLINLTGDAKEVGQILTDSQIIQKLSFTGSTATGRILMKQCADTIKKLSLELGGNAPVIIFDDANLDQAVTGIMASKFRNSGQTCVCANRIYVQANIYESLIHRLKEEVLQLKVGNGLDESTTQGPLIDERAVEKVSLHIQDAVEKGAQVIVGGSRSELGQTFFEPTIVIDVNQSMRVAKEETFGPLAAVFKFETENEVVEMANDTEFGLAAYVFTQNATRQWRISEALEYGMVGINTGAISNELAPFGGVKQSGLGREGSKYGIEEYLELKYMCLDLTP